MPTPQENLPRYLGVVFDDGFPFEIPNSIFSDDELEVVRDQCNNYIREIQSREDISAEILAKVYYQLYQKLP